MIQVWAYERIFIDRPNYAHRLEHWLPCARAWAYRRNNDAMTEAKRLYPYHNQIFYIDELDEMTGAMIRWAPYMRFENLVGANYEEAWYGWASRIPPVWFDVVEFQMSNRDNSFKLNKVIQDNSFKLNKDNIYIKNMCH